MKKFTVKAGRQIYFGDEPFVSIGREGSTSPTAADKVAHLIAKCLNKSPTAKKLAGIKGY